MLQSRLDVVIEGRQRALLNAARVVRRMQDRIRDANEEKRKKEEFLFDRREKLRMLRRELERLSGASAIDTIRKWATLPMRKSVSSHHRHRLALRDHTSCAQPPPLPLVLTGCTWLGACRYFLLWRKWLSVTRWERSIVNKIGFILCNRSLAAAFRTWKANVSDQHRAEEEAALAKAHADSQTLSEFMLTRMEGHRRNITKQVLNTLTLLTRTGLDAGTEEVRSLPSAAARSEVPRTYQPTPRPCLSRARRSRQRLRATRTLPRTWCSPTLCSRKPGPLPKSQRWLTLRQRRSWKASIRCGRMCRPPSCLTKRAAS